MARINAVVPSYYRDFVCKCGACRTVCCQGWRITLSMREYYSLIGLDCSPKLRDRLDRAFYLFDRPDESRYAYIAPGYDGKCRILGDDGYCSMQRECGESVLPEVCRFYPRAVKRGREGEKNSAVFSAGCENTVELLMNTDTLTFSEEKIVIPGDDIPSDAGYALAGEEKEAMFGAISIAQDREMCFAGRLKKICGAEESADCIRVFGAMIKFIAKLAESSHNIRDFGLEALSYYGIDMENTGSADISSAYEKYAAAYAYVRENMKLFERHRENLLINHIYYTQYPFVEGLDRGDSSAALCALFAMLNVIVCGWIRSHSNTDMNISFADSVSAVFRMAEHSDYYRTAAMLLHALNMTAGDMSALL